MARRSREDWLREGLKVLKEEGVDGLKVDSLCAALNVTKGSFYHHFGGREAFLEGILEYWEERFTLQFIAESERGGTALERLERLLQLVLQSYGSEEIKLRGWAERDPLALSYVEKMDRQRLLYLEHLALEVLGDPQRARVIAHMFYVSLLGSAAVKPPLTREELAEIFASVKGLLSTPQTNS